MGVMEDLHRKLEKGAGSVKQATRRLTIKRKPGYDPATDEFLRQNVRFASAEEGRPNRVYNLSVTAPATPVAAGTATGTLTVNIQQDAFINSIHFPAVAGDAWVCNSLKFGSFEIVNNGYMCLEGLAAAVERFCRLVPVANRRLPAGTVISGNFLNIYTEAGVAVARSFPGVAIEVLEPVCVDGQGGSTRTKVMPGIFSWSALRGLVGRIAKPNLSARLR